MVFDVMQARAQFPSLNNPAIFFDNPAGTQVPQRVIDAVTEYFTHMNANSGGEFATSQRTDAAVEAARERMADFLNAPSPHDIVIGANMTTLNFALSRAIAKQHLQAGDEIVLTRMDHDANVAPWLRVAQDVGAVVRWVDIRAEDCTLDMSSLEMALSERTKIVATVQASNAVGTVNPIQQIAEMSHAVGALHIVDAVQSAPHIPIDVQALGCDFLLCSSYKFFGPHLGIMWGRHDLLESLPAYKVRPSKNKSPNRWETGTPAFELIHALGATIDYLASFGADADDEQSGFTGRKRDLRAAMLALQTYERDLVTHLIEVLRQTSGVQIAGITDTARFDWRVPTVVFNREGYTPQQIAQHLGKQGIYVWNGNYYAVEIMERLGHQDGMVRVGLAHYNTHAEIDRFAEVLNGMS